MAWFYLAIGAKRNRSLMLEDWAYRRGVQLDFTRPGKPMENAFIESFNGRLRDEKWPYSFEQQLKVFKSGSEGPVPARSRNLAGTKSVRTVSAY